MRHLCPYKTSLERSDEQRDASLHRFSVCENCQGHGIPEKSEQDKDPADNHTRDFPPSHHRSSLPNLDFPSRHFVAALLSCANCLTGGKRRLSPTMGIFRRLFPRRRIVSGVRIPFQNAYDLGEGPRIEMGIELSHCPLPVAGELPHLTVRDVSHPQRCVEEVVPFAERQVAPFLLFAASCDTCKRLLKMPVVRRTADRSLSASRKTKL